MIMLKSTYYRLIQQVKPELMKLKRRAMCAEDDAGAWKFRARQFEKQLGLSLQDLAVANALLEKQQQMLDNPPEPETPKESTTDEERLELVEAAIRIEVDSKPLRMADRSAKRRKIQNLNTERTKLIEAMNRQPAAAVQQS